MAMDEARERMKRPLGITICVIFEILVTLAFVLLTLLAFVGGIEAPFFGWNLAHMSNGERSLLIAEQHHRQVIGMIVCAIGATTGGVVSWGLYRVKSWGRIGAVMTALPLLVIGPLTGSADAENVWLIPALLVLYLLLADPATVAAFRKVPTP
ncbi:MAG: hypothetical protein ACREJQ_07005, partial [bacterium]